MQKHAVRALFLILFTSASKIGLHSTAILFSANRTVVTGGAAQLLNSRYNRIRRIAG